MLTISARLLEGGPQHKLRTASGTFAVALPTAPTSQTAAPHRSAYRHDDGSTFAALRICMGSTPTAFAFLGARAASNALPMGHKRIIASRARVRVRFLGRCRPR
jgi:hypothetical protein